MGGVGRRFRGAVGSWRSSPFADGPDEMHVPNRESSSSRVPISAAFGIRTSECCRGARRPLPAHRWFLVPRHACSAAFTAVTHLGEPLAEVVRREQLLGRRRRLEDGGRHHALLVLGRYQDQDPCTRTCEGTSTTSHGRGAHTRTSLVEEGAHGDNAQAGGHDHNVLGLGEPATIQAAARTRTRHVSERLIDSAMAGNTHRK